MKIFSNNSGVIWLKVRMNWQIINSVEYGLSNWNLTKYLFVEADFCVLPLEFLNLLV